LADKLLKYREEIKSRRKLGYRKLEKIATRKLDINK
jgi:hypothetical protein